MQAELKPYPRMKDSGVPWLGEVPAHWDILPARAAYKPKLVKNNGMAEKRVLSLSYGQIVVKPEEKLRGLIPESFESYQIVDPGDIIVRTTDLQNDHTSLRIGFSKHRGIITAAYMCLVSNHRLSKQFGYQFLNAYDLLKIIYGYGSGLRQNLDFGHIKRMPVLVPPTDEQNAIVRFLDHADRRTRRYIRAKQKQIKLLEELKQAIIHQAVTGRIDVRTGRPYPAYKDSGIEWIARVPEHWVVSALRHRYSQCLGKMLDSKRITGTHSINYLRNIDVQWDRINLKNLPVMDIKPSEYSRYTMQEGDLLVCEGGEVGRCAIWTGDIAVCGFQKALHRLRVLKEGNDIPRFLYYVFRSAAKSDAFNDGHLSTIAHLTGDKLRAHRFAFPPVDEQSLLVLALDSVSEQVDIAIANELNKISLLREYRTRLIADVVTGKLDVRETAARLPEEIEEEVDASGNGDETDDELAPDAEAEGA